MLRLHRLTKQYASHQPPALNQVTLTVPTGQVVALIGASGAGKSTLIRCVNRLVQPTSGEVWLDDVDVTRLSPRALRRMRRQMGMIFQNYALVDRLTVMENVLAGQLGYVSAWQSWWRLFPPATIAEALQLLEQVGLADVVNRRADALSGGQRQRVGIARALLQRPSLLLVDEPTASLDPKTARQVMRLLTDLSHDRGLTVLINIHNVPLAQEFAQRIVGLRLGEVVYDGDPAGLTTTTLTTIYGAEDWTAMSDRAAIPTP